MATKPTISFVNLIHSQDDNYTTGPPELLGSLTKIAPPDAELREGWNADQKPPAQFENFLGNRQDQYCAWVELGSISADLNAHIIEANFEGTVRIASIRAGDTGHASHGIFVRPNSGEGEAGIFAQNQYTKPAGIFETNNLTETALIVRAPPAVIGGIGGNPGIFRVETGDTGVSTGPPGLHIQAETAVDVPAMRINQTGRGFGLLINGGDGDPGNTQTGSAAIEATSGVDAGGESGGPAGRFIGAAGYTLSGSAVLLVESDDATPSLGVEVKASDTMTGLQIFHTGGLAPCVRLRGFDAGGADRSAPLVLVPQTFSLGGVNVEDGAMWHEQSSFAGGKQIHPRFHGDDSSWYHWGRNPMCAIFKENKTLITGPGTGAFFDILTNAIFPLSLIPIDTGDVIISVFFDVQRTANGSDIEANAGATFEVIDVTATNDVIFVTTVDLHPTTGGDEDRLKVYFSAKFKYTLPAPGQREFKMQIQRGNSPGGTSSITVTSIVFHLIADH